MLVTWGEPSEVYSKSNVTPFGFVICNTFEYIECP